MAAPLIYADGALYPLCEGHPCHCMESEDYDLEPQYAEPDWLDSEPQELTPEEEDSLEEWEHARRARLAERLEY